MKVGIIIISTGEKYHKYYEKLSNSIKEKFCPEIKDKKIILFSDGVNLVNLCDQIFYIKHLPQPLTTLMRFHYFLMAKSLLEQYDILYYIDCDAEINKIINFEEVCPESQDQFVVVRHPWANSNDNRWLVENNPKSTSYIENVEIYCQGSFFGAYKDSFFKLIEECNQQINKNLLNRIISRWDDESHFNKYIYDKKLKVLHWKFSAPFSKENVEIAKILHYNIHEP
jgi:hypothetical protein